MIVASPAGMPVNGSCACSPCTAGGLGVFGVLTTFTPRTVVQSFLKEWLVALSPGALTLPVPGVSSWTGEDSRTIWSARTVTCLDLPLGDTTVKVTSSVVVSSTFMLVSVTEMPALQALANETAGSVTDCTSSQLAGRVNVPPGTSPSIVSVTVGWAASVSSCSSFVAPPATSSLIASLVPAGAVEDEPPAVPPSMGTVTPSQSPVTVPEGGVDSCGASPMHAAQ